MRVGIIGASGFLGSNLAAFLAEKPGYEVFATSRRPSSEQVKNLSSQIAAQWGELDLSQSTGIESFLSSVDAVFYLAHEGGPSISDSWKHECEINLRALMNFLEGLKQVKRTKPLKVIYVSSGGTVYGDSDSKTRWKETDLPLPLSTYGVLKLTAENYFRIAAKQGLCEAICLRVANPYGNRFPHFKNQGLVDVAISQMRAKQPFQLFGSDQIVRDFISVKDLNVAFEAALKISTPFEIINIGSGQGATVEEVLNLIQTEARQTLEIKRMPLSASIIPVRWSVLDPTKAKAVLGWSTRISLKEGLHSQLNVATP